MGLGLNMSMVAAIGAIGMGLSLGLLASELGEPEKEARFQPLSISMSLAVQTAEAVAPGQAIHAQLDIVQGRPVYEIDMLGFDQSLNKVQVGAEDGNVAVVMSDDQEQVGKIEQAPSQKKGAI